MQTQYFTRRHFCYIAAAGSMAIAGIARAQAPQPMRLRATIDAVDGKSLSLTTRAGEKVTVSLAPDVAVAAIVASAHLLMIKSLLFFVAQESMVDLVLKF